MMDEQVNESIKNVFKALAKSSFCQRFWLQRKELEYLNTKGISTVLLHAEDFIHNRLAVAAPLKDGKQTPFRGHPIFIALHATACCCRGCLEKWHNISHGQALSQEQKITLFVF